MTEWTDEAMAAHDARVAAEEALGRCPYAGMTIARCWHTELCDCSMSPPTVCPDCFVSVWDLDAHRATVKR